MFMREYHQRLAALRQKIRTLAIDALLVTTPANIFYLTGIVQLEGNRECSALVSEKNFHIFVHSTFFEEGKSQVKNGHVISIDGKHPLAMRLEQIGKKEHVATIGFESSDVSVAQYNRLKQLIKTITWKETVGLVEEIRQKKDANEIDHIREAAKITDDAFAYILPHIKEGVEEKDIALELEMYLKRKSDGLAFAPIVASGVGNASPHYISRRKKIKKGEMVLLDFGAKMSSYCADLTRMVFIGNPDKQYKKIYKTVLQAQEKAIAYVLKKQQEGKIATKDVDEIARSSILKDGYPNIPHGLGHAVGIEIHESPRLSPIDQDMLKPGMVFTIEPGIYIPNWGGVRIEDLLAWSDKGIEVLSRSPKHLLTI